jgi:hypothetical protein
MSPKTSALRRTFPALLVLSALPLLAPSARAQDTVVLKDGKTESGRVKSAEYEGVSIESKGQAKTIEWQQVASISYKDPPEEYVAGKDAFEGQKWDDAIAAFDKLKADAKVRAPIRQDAFYFSAAAQLQKGSWDAAIAGFDALRKEFPKSRYLLEAGEGYVAAFTQKKDGAGAARALDSMSNDAGLAGVPASFSATINLLKGRLLEDSGKLAEASAAYGVAEKTSGVTLLVQQHARLGQGRCLLANKKYGEAEPLFRKLTNEDAPNVILAGAWNGLGQVWTAEALEKNDAEKIDKLLDAAFAYMRGVAQYGPGPGEPVREYRRSLEGAAKTFQNLAGAEKNAERKAVYQRRAAERQEALNRELSAGR